MCSETSRDFPATLEKDLRIKIELAGIVLESTLFALQDKGRLNKHGSAVLADYGESDARALKTAVLSPDNKPLWEARAKGSFIELGESRINVDTVALASRSLDSAIGYILSDHVLFNDPEIPINNLICVRAALYGPLPGNLLDLLEPNDNKCSTDQSGIE